MDPRCPSPTLVEDNHPVAWREQGSDWSQVIGNTRTSVQQYNGVACSCIVASNYLRCWGKHVERADAHPRSAVSVLEHTCRHKLLIAPQVRGFQARSIARLAVDG